jgi:hypothetical protein
MNLVAPANFSGLGELFNDFTKARTQSRVNEAMRLADLSNPESLLQTGQSLARAGDLQTGLSLAQLGRQMQTEQRQREADQRAFEMLSGGGQRPQMPMGGQQRAASNQVAGLGDSPLPASLIQNESGGRLDARNNVMGAGGMPGHFGRAQFGQARMQDAMAAGAIPQGTTPEQFMANPQLQQAAETWHVSDINSFVDRSGLNRFEGQTVGGVPVTRQGMIAVAHLGGNQGLQRFLESGGRYNPADANGTRLSDYLARHGGSGQQVAQAPMQQQAPASPQMGDAMMRAQRIEQALQIPGLSQAARQQLTAQLQALAGQMQTERQAGAPTPAMREYDLAVRQGFRGTFQDYQRQAAQSGPEGGSLTPTWGIDAQGRPVALQARRDGTMVPFSMQEGVSIARDPIRVDTPTGTVLLDPQTRQQVEFVPKDIAGAAVAQAVGERAGTEIAGAPQEARNARTLLGQIDAVLSDRNLGIATGLPGMVTTRIPGTPTFDLGQRIEQLRGQAFLQAFESLKGGGAITETEGQKATQAIARLNSSQSTEGFVTALRELREVVEGARQRAESRVPTNRAATPAQRPASPRTQQQGNPIDAARDAISRGAPRDAVIQRLRENGIDASGL